MGKADTTCGRLIGLVLLTIISATFAHIWCLLEYNIFCHGIGSPDLPLPGLTQLFHAYHRWGYAMVLLPIGAAWAQTRPGRNCGVASEALAQGAMVLSVAWALACIVAWRLPYLTIRTQIGG